MILFIEYEPKILSADRVQTLLKEKTGVKAHEYDVCPSGCKLFKLTGNEQKCPHCNQERFKVGRSGEALVPSCTMKMMSIGDQLAKLLSNDDHREKLHFRHKRVDLPGYITDYFDGENYKALKAANMFNSPDDIAIVLYVDGFVTQKKSKQGLVIVHVLVLNYDPSLR